MATLHLKPAEGLRVVNPVTRQALPPGGDQVEASTYWYRRLAEGDVVELKADSLPLQTAAEGAASATKKPNRSTTP